jgi:cobalt-precorrin 5A hydrolase
VSAAIYCAGLGCRSGCPETSLRQLLEQTLRECGLTIEQLAGLASIDVKRDEPGLRALAKTLNLPLTFFSAQQLARFENRVGAISTPTVRVAGAAGVAEAAALALAEQYSNSSAELIVDKRKNADATVALARPAQAEPFNGRESE